jgi:hypothetical protein
MTDTIFRIGNMVALLAWVALVASLFLPRLGRPVRRIAGVAVPALLGIAYVGLIAGNWLGAAGGFSSPEAVRALFDTPGLLVAGWLHYLAFDLFVGSWMAADAERRGLSRFAVLPCLPLTFAFGPAGLVLFLVLRTLFARAATGRSSGETFA